MDTPDNNDASSHELPEKEEGTLSPPSITTESSQKPEPAIPSQEQLGGIKGTGVFTVADGLDPSTRARLEKKEAETFLDEEITGSCGHCGRPFNVGRPEAKCMACGMVMHQFCFDGHVIKEHKPKAIGVRIISKDGKFYARSKRSDEK